MATPSRETKRPKRMREGNYLPTPSEAEHIQVLRAKLLDQEDFQFYHLVCDDFRKGIIAQVVADTLVVCQRLLQLKTDIRCQFYWDNQQFPDGEVEYGQATGDSNDLFISLNTFGYVNLPAIRDVMKVVQDTTVHEAAHLYVMLRYPEVSRHYEQSKELEETFCDLFEQEYDRMRSVQQRAKVSRNAYRRSVGQ